jgi:hypothetical protein
MAKVKNNPSFFYEYSSVTKDSSSKGRQHNHGQAKPFLLSVAMTDSTDAKSEATNKEKMEPPQCV